MARLRSAPRVVRRAQIVWLITGLFLLGAVIAALWLLQDLPSPEDLGAYTTAPSSKVYDRYGRLLFEIPPPYTGSHTPVALDEIPLALRQATIALEDRNFYINPGIDLRGILRALWYNLHHNDSDNATRLMGGSTITQQLVRNLLLSPSERYEQTLRRKLRETILSIRVTLRYSKDEILSFYLNETYYGNMAYGVEAAAQAYYGKHARDLDLAECAMLAVLPHAPAYWNPLENLDEAELRQAIVLDRMEAEGYITTTAAELAKQEKLYFAAAPFPIRAPHFVMYVRGLLEQELGLARLQAGGLEIHTTLDLDLTDTARDLLRHRLEMLAICEHEIPCPPGGYNVRNGAVVALDPTTGEVLAMVGSPDYFSARIDGAVNGTTALRQPGSAIKPLTYAAAFTEGGMTPATVIMDVRTTFTTREGTPYVPLNYDLAFHGPVRLREALASSYNVVAVKVLDNVGIETMTGLARMLGITTFDTSERLGLSLTLGGGEVRLLDLTATYAAFANGGYAVAPRVIRSVTDVEGTPLWKASCVSPDCARERVLSAEVAYLITDILSDDQARIPAFGEGSVLALSRPTAAKTGTTTDFRDNWTLGYTPDLVVGVWVGNADNEVMRGVTGISGAAPLWRDVMEIAHRGLPEDDFVRPPDLIEVEVCALSGQRPNADCPHRITEFFVAGTEPTEQCTMHQRSGDEVIVILPVEAQEWASERDSEARLGVETPAEATEPGVLFLTKPDSGSAYHIDPATPRSQQRIWIRAETDISLTRLVLLVDEVAWTNFAAPPYTALWQLEPGTHRFQARGEDETGEIWFSAPVEITVK